MPFLTQFCRRCVVCCCQEDVSSASSKAAAASVRQQDGGRALAKDCRQPPELRCDGSIARIHRPSAQQVGAHSGVRCSPPKPAHLRHVSCWLSAQDWEPVAERIAVTAWGIDEALGLENAVIMTKQVPLEEEEKPTEEEPLWQCAPAPPVLTSRRWCDRSPHSDLVRTPRLRLSEHFACGVRRALVNAGMIGLLGGWVGKNIGLL